MKRKFKFTGSVLMFDRLISNHWEGTTYAVTEKQALNNLTYRCKSQFGYIPATQITLQGKLLEV